MKTQFYCNGKSGIEMVSSADGLIEEIKYMLEHENLKESTINAGAGHFHVRCVYIPDLCIDAMFPGINPDTVIEGYVDMATASPEDVSKLMKFRLEQI